MSEGSINLHASIPDTTTKILEKLHDWKAATDGLVYYAKPYRKLWKNFYSRETPMTVPVVYQWAVNADSLYKHAVTVYMVIVKTK